MEEIKDEAPVRGAFLTTAGKVAASGFALVKRDALRARLEACRACALAIKTKRLVTCSACGCDMGVKARFAATTCPIDPDW